MSWFLPSRIEVNVEIKLDPVLIQILRGMLITPEDRVKIDRLYAQGRVLADRVKAADALTPS